MTATAADGTFLARDRWGRLLLVIGRPGATTSETAWTCLWTEGHRTLRAVSGTCVHAGPDGRARHLARVARARVEAARKSLPADAVGAHARALLARAGGSPADGPLARFSAACGAATLRAAALGSDARRMRALDARFGATEVDRVLGASPLLAALAFHPAADPDGIEVGDAFHAAAAGHGLPEAIVLLARRVDAAGRPGRGPRDADAEDREAERLEAVALAIALGGDGGVDDPGDMDFGEDEDGPDDDFHPAPPWAVQRMAGVRPDDVRAESLPGMPQGSPASCAALLRRLGPAHVASEWAASLVLHAAWLPPDWLPSDGDEAACSAAALDVAAGIALESGGAVSARDLVAPSRGRWRPFVDQLARVDAALAVPVEGGKPSPGPRLAPGIGRRAAVIGVRDMVRRFLDQLAAPALAQATGVADHGTEAAQALHRHAWKTLLRDKGLAAALQASSDWHARRAGIDRLVRTLSDGRQWPRPFPDFTATDGTVATPLLSAVELAEEGAELMHCVGDYADRCEDGSTVVVSLRRPSPGGERRSSTLELEWGRHPSGRPPRGWIPEISQHRSLMNGLPSQPDVRAAAELVAWLAQRADEGKAGPRDRSEPAVGGPGARGWRWPLLLARWADRLDPQPRPDPFDPARAQPTVEGQRLATRCGYDWRDPGQVALAHAAWSPFLARDLRATPGALIQGLGHRGGPQQPPPVRSSGPGPGLRIARGLTARAGRGARALALALFGNVYGLGSIVAALCLAWSLGAVAPPGWTAARAPVEGPAATPVPSPRPPATEGEALAEGLRRLVGRSPADCPAEDAEPTPPRHPGAGGPACARLGPLLVRAVPGGYRVTLPVDGLPPVDILSVTGGRAKWSQPAWSGAVTRLLAEAGVPPPWMVP